LTMISFTSRESIVIRCSDGRLCGWRSEEALGEVKE
jgi:hypothetical protein